MSALNCLYQNKFPNFVIFVRNMATSFLVGLHRMSLPTLNFISRFEYHVFAITFAVPRL